jgi:hypothetical protein
MHTCNTQYCVFALCLCHMCINTLLHSVACAWTVHQMLCRIAHASLPAMLFDLRCAPTHLCVLLHMCFWSGCVWGVVDNDGSPPHSSSNHECGTIGCRGDILPPCLGTAADNRRGCIPGLWLCMLPCMACAVSNLGFCVHMCMFCQPTCMPLWAGIAAFGQSMALAHHQSTSLHSTVLGFGELGSCPDPNANGYTVHNRHRVQSPSLSPASHQGDACVGRLHQCCVYT